MGSAGTALLIDRNRPHSTSSEEHKEGATMDVNTLTFAFVIVALGIGGVIVYLKGK
jgi:hypothetical protein